MTAPHIGISHAAHVEGRRAALAELRAAIGNHEVHVEDRRAPCWLRSQWEWEAMAASGASHVLHLDDDVLVSPRFVARVTALVEARPASLIGLYTPDAAPGARAMATRWVWGTAWVAPRARIVELLQWRDALPSRRWQAIGEDQLLGAFAEATGAESLWCVPGLVDRRPVSELPSTSIEMAPTACVRWDDPAFAGVDLESPDGWRGPTVRRQEGPTALEFLTARPERGGRLLCARRWGIGFSAVPVPAGREIEIESAAPVVLLEGNAVLRLDPGARVWKRTDHPDECSAWIALEAMGARDRAVLVWIEDERGETNERPEITWEGA